MNFNIKTLTLLLAGLFVGVFFVPQQAVAEDHLLPFQLGIKGGIPITDTFTTYGGFSTHYSTANRRWIVGPTAEIHLAGPVSLEVDALFRRVGFDASMSYAPSKITTGGTIFQPTVANWWEFPALFKVHITDGPIRPYFVAGASLRHITSMRQTTYTPAYYAPIITDNSVDLIHRNSPGLVGGFGAAYVIHHFHLNTEMRYTRWFNQAFEDSNNRALKSRLDQIDFLIGFTL